MPKKGRQGPRRSGGERNGKDPFASATAASPAATVANTLTHEHYVHLTLIVSSVVDVFKEVHNISDYVEVDLEKVTSTFEAAFLQMMKEEGLGSFQGLQRSILLGPTVLQVPVLEARLR